MAKSEATKPAPRAQVILRSEEEVDSLIDDLRRCKRESKRTGGQYCAGVHDTDGEVIIHVWLPYVPRIGRKI